MKRLSFVVAFVWCGCCYAETYIATGSFKGTVCKGFGIEFCGTHDIVAVGGDDGKLYEMKTEYQHVDEYNGKRCIIRTKSTGLGPISWAINAAKQPAFFSRDEKGVMKELNVEHIAFPCEKRL